MADNVKSKKVMTDPGKAKAEAGRLVQWYYSIQHTGGDVCPPAYLKKYHDEPLQRGMDAASSSRVPH